jgi:hypothetical protein
MSAFSVPLLNYGGSVTFDSPRRSVLVASPPRNLFCFFKPSTMFSTMEGNGCGSSSLWRKCKMILRNE